METPYYQEKLKLELERRVEKNPRYSLRSLAQVIKMSPGALSQILAGKRVPSLRTAERVIEGLRLSPEDAEAFLSSLAEVHRSRGLQRVNPFFKKFDRVEAPRRELSSQMFKVISDWYHYALLELTESKGFRPDIKWIASELGITQMEAKLAFERLLELELLHKEDGVYKKTNLKFTTADKNVTTAALKNHQKQILEKAIHSLEHDPIEIRSMSSVTMAINPKKVKEAKKLIFEFNQKLANFLTADHQEQVYQLSIALFPAQRRKQS